MVVDDIQLQAALVDGDAIVDGHEITLGELETCVMCSFRLAALGLAGSAFEADFHL